MTEKAVIHDMSPDEVMKIVRNLRSKGLIQGKDFDFKYFPFKWDEMTGNHPPSTEFTFYDGNEKWATIFKIKYS